MKDALIKDLNFIIKTAITGITNYKILRKIRYEIEFIFKTAKHIFGMKKLHVYSIDATYWNIHSTVFSFALFTIFTDSKY